MGNSTTTIYGSGSGNMTSNYTKQCHECGYKYPYINHIFQETADEQNVRLLNLKSLPRFSNFCWFNIKDFCDCFTNCVFDTLNNQDRSSVVFC